MRKKESSRAEIPAYYKWHQITIGFNDCVRAIEIVKDKVVIEILQRGPRYIKAIKLLQESEG